MRLLLALLILSFNVPTAGAQEYAFEQHANYSRLSRQALKMPQNFNFNVFRAHYTQTEQFAPIADKIKDKLMNDAYVAGNADTKAKRETALRSYQALVTKHLANIDVVMLALTLSRENPQLGSPRVFEWLRDGILDTVKYSGDGTNLHYAYNVVTMGEEPALMRELKVNVLKTDFHHEAFEYYNVHLVKDAKGKTREIYVDVSIPLKILEDRKEQARQKLLLPAQ